MLTHLSFVESKDTFPYRNMAIEEWLTENVGEDQAILYLWRNRKTVVIGKNQNCWKECNVNALEKDGGFLARRLSGGGAVYHDEGNLNFTFCVSKKNYNLDKQLEVILRAVNLLGIDGKKTGRNDLTVDGKKFSGNAFYNSGDKCYHHGTILLNVKTEDMGKYLNVDKSKLSSKGVESVKSRVAGLSEYSEKATVPAMIEALKKAFSDIYNLPVSEVSADEFPSEQIDTYENKFQSWQWKYGQNIPFDYQIVKRFPWGDINLQFHIEKGIVKQVNLFSDAMDQNLIENIGDCLAGTIYSADGLCKALSGVKRHKNFISDEEETKKIINDITNLIREGI